MIKHMVYTKRKLPVHELAKVCYESLEIMSEVALRRRDLEDGEVKKLLKAHQACRMYLEDGK